jgi:hypothetical protein
LAAGAEVEIRRIVGDDRVGDWRSRNAATVADIHTLNVGIVRSRVSQAITRPAGLLVPLE